MHTHPGIEQKKQYTDSDNNPFTVHLSEVENDLLAGSNLNGTAGTLKTKKNTFN